MGRRIVDATCCCYGSSSSSSSASVAGCCDGTLPAQYQADLAGVGNGTCVDCVATFNAAPFVLDKISEGDECIYQYSGQHVTCGFPGFVAFTLTLTISAAGVQFDVQYTGLGGGLRARFFEAGAVECALSAYALTRTVDTDTECDWTSATCMITAL